MKLYLGGIFSFYLPGNPGEVDLELAGPVRLDQLLESLGIPTGEIHLTVVNGELVDLHEAIVSPSDDVKLYPPSSGG